MQHRDAYQKKLTTAEKAVACIQSGDWVDYGWCVAMTDKLDRALAARYQELQDVKVRSGVLMRKPAIMQVPDAPEHFTFHSWHFSGVDRKMVADGAAFYIPMRYSELPRFYREDVAPIRAAMFQVSPMDDHGYFSFGPSVSHMAAVCDRAEYIIVEVNENMPRCLGGREASLHISQVDMVVEGDNPPIPELGGGGALSDVDRKVAELIVEEIPNGACLQLGIGGMPNAVGSLICESDLRDLGVHTEMYVDAFVDLTEAGKITGAKKTLDRYCQTYAFGAGTKKTYDFLHDNPGCLAAPVDYTNAVEVIAQIDNFMSINNAVDIDLFGQISAESSGPRQISGTGGQLDFVMGAYQSKGGKSFVCCSATYTDRSGELQSRIRPTLTNGSIATDPRTTAHWLVTEFGKVNLKGLATWQRAEAILSLAHPQFHDILIKEADAMNIWRRSNKR